MMTGRTLPSRRGFVSTILVLVVMLTVTLLATVCVKTLFDGQRQMRLSLLETQLECMVLAADQWISANGPLEDGETREVVISDLSDPIRCTLDLTQVGKSIEGEAIIERAGKRVAGRKFILTPHEQEG